MLCFLVIGIIAFANTGGMSGAGIIVPFMMGFYRFDAKNAIMLSNFSVPCSGTVRYITNLREPHPLKNGTGVLVDYNIVCLMMPASIIGASIGSIFNLILPGPIILALFIIVTFFTTYTSLRKYCSLRKTESNNIIKVAVTNPSKSHHIP